MLVFQQGLIDPFGQLNDSVEVVASRGLKKHDMGRLSDIISGKLYSCTLADISYIDVVIYIYENVHCCHMMKSYWKMEDCL